LKTQKSCVPLYIRDEKKRGGGPKNQHLMGTKKREGNSKPLVLKKYREKYIKIIVKKNKVR
jgi:hypothetical protein